MNDWKKLCDQSLHQKVSEDVKSSPPPHELFGEEYLGRCSRLPVLKIKILWIQPKTDVRPPNFDITIALVFL